MALLEDEVSTLEDSAFYFSDSKDVRECVCMCMYIYVCVCARERAD